MTDRTAAQPLTEGQLVQTEAFLAGLGQSGVVDAETARLLVAEVRRLRELEAPAVQARAALAALCYDLEDPGSDAYGALYLLSRATVGIDAPKDDAALALGTFASDVLHKVADMADPEAPEVSFFGVQAGPQVAAWLRMLADRKATTTALAAPAGS
ncbi:hypothetical protein B0675_40110 [Streptomyces sp. M41(2017)]|uniref:hypothetical protein n=1 Tax=Streptomyces sp. M41(2017) TaxID=1955065 RepID=UPI0009BD1C66|nr:hypothetical protein [Streptomyces sp. M41(2017)]OQQ13025.1 hypothetical protein B0675_40110 [Streptomyces sp. M41(2017)]